jgi:hypothetical protein
MHLYLLASLHLAMCLVCETMRSVKIAVLSFAVSTLAYSGLSAKILSQPEFSGHTLTSFGFGGHALA